MAACLPAVGTRTPLDLATVPIRCERNLILVPVSVAGSPPFHVVLDTGMASRGLLLYGSERVEALGLEFTDTDEISGSGGNGATIRTRSANDISIQIGELELTGVPVITLPSPPGFPPSHDGIIGSELFERFAVRIDVDASRLTFLDAATLAAEEGSSVIPLHFRGEGPFLHTHVAVGDGDLLPAELAIDTGASHALWLNDGRESRFGPPPESIETRLGRGLSGSVEGRVGRVRRLELGGFALERVVAVFPRAGHQHPGGVDFRDGFVGGNALKRFRVTFDYAGQRMILEPGLHYRDPFEHDMSGLVLEPPRADRRTVESVLANSPAALAGILPGDILVAIDGQSLGTLGPDGIVRALSVENAELQLTLERGSQTLLKRIRLRRLV